MKHHVDSTSEWSQPTATETQPSTIGVQPMAMEDRYTATSTPSGASSASVKAIVAKLEMNARKKEYKGHKGTDILGIKHTAT